jgi:energy-coupling factor transporter ATP-binding protein EcfA2
MRLKSVQIQHFRSVEDSEEFAIEQVTCLVGKNEAGKSAVLQCLAALNPHAATPAILDRERDYPRRFLTQYLQRHPTEAAIAVSTKWELSEDELAKVKVEFGDGVLKSKEIRILRRYGAAAPEWQVDVDHHKAFEFLFEAHGLDEDEQRSLTAADSTKELIEALAKLSTSTEKQRALLTQLQTYGSVTKKIVAILSQSFPRFMYFTHYDRMDGAIQIELLREITGQNRLGDEGNKGLLLFQEFQNYAGVPLDDILSVNTYETFNAKLQAASNNITDQILEYWTQNPDLSIDVRIEQAKQGDPAPFNTGTIARARIYNHLHRAHVTYRPSIRSRKIRRCDSILPQPSRTRMDR